MSDGKRRRYRKGKEERDKDKQRLVILAKRDDDQRHGDGTNTDIKPKILLKSKIDKEQETAHTSSNTNENALLGCIQKTIIVNRSEHAQSPAMSASTSPNITLQRDVQRESSAGNVDAVAQNLTNMQLIEPVPRMTRPTTIISSTGFVNANVKKLLMKQNTEFLVVGIIGPQGVGKSTIMNMLANEQVDFDYYTHLLAKDDGMFRTRIKPNKCPSRSGTESVHMYINSDRVILLDTPPVLTNPYKKDMTSTELDDLHLIIGLYSICHLLIVVQDDYVNLNFMRLLRFAEIMKPQTQEDKQIVSGYLPQVLFVKNRVKPMDLNNGQPEEFNSLMRACFDDSQLNIFLYKNAKSPTTATANSPCHQSTMIETTARTSEQAVGIKQKRTRNSEQETSTLNVLLIPNIEDADEASQMELKKTIKKLHRCVFMTSRNQMYYGAAELFTELVWFDMLSKVWQETQYFFLNTYADMHRKVYDVCVLNGNGGSGSGGNNNGSHHSSYGKDGNDWKVYGTEKCK